MCEILYKRSKQCMYDKDVEDGVEQNVSVCLFRSSTSLTYIALQPLGTFDLSSTSLTCFNIHSI